MTTTTHRQYMLILVVMPTGEHVSAKYIHTVLVAGIREVLCIRSETSPTINGSERCKRRRCYYFLVLQSAVIITSTENCNF